MGRFHNNYPILNRRYQIRLKWNFKKLEKETKKQEKGNCKKDFFTES